MISQQVLEGNWNEIKGRIRQRWGQLTESDLPKAQGNMEELVGIIQRRTGEAREAIENSLEELAGHASSGAAMASEAVRDYARQATETFQQSAKRARDQVRGSYIEAERFVRDRPVQSLVTCFGIGLISGLVIGMSLRSR